MKAIIEKSVANGKIKAPPSKSMAHRALICGAFSESSKICNVAYSDDINATLDCLESLGAFVEKYDDYVIIGGLDINKIQDGASLFCNESGSTLRFLVPICMVSGKKITLKGSKRLFERPLSVYEKIAEENGIYFEKGVDYITVNGRLQSGEYVIPGNISSQFITGMLYALSLLDSDSKISVSGAFESASYIDLTFGAMASFGVEIKKENNEFFVNGGNKYQSQEYYVEGDCSNAAFLEVFNYLGGSVDVEGISPDTMQGDRVYLQMFKDIKNGKKCFDISDCPDLAPILFALSAVYGGAKFTGTARLKLKESDRAAVMAEELAKFGIDVKVEENSVIIENCELYQPQEELCGHNDHRIVMALSSLCSVTGGTVNDAQAVKKSYPDYFEVISSLGISVKKVN
ncbi:MAG: 3-phosphoshikimate 1-carboxyvinyltransferase [Clostridia bacterium]|nr:3-phosphoshikimate 1-carboxyvinyltransferase [Clostridia bacterium]